MTGDLSRFSRVAHIPLAKPLAADFLIWGQGFLLNEQKWPLLGHSGSPVKIKFPRGAFGAALSQVWTVEPWGPQAVRIDTALGERVLSAHAAPLALGELRPVRYHSHAKRCGQTVPFLLFL